MASKLLIKFEKTIGFTSVRCLHQINISKGGGGRSSYSGVSATVFGGNGQVGRACVNHLAACGTQLILPFRGEEKRVLDLRVMSDLGQMMFRPWSMKAEDDYTEELIRYSNCVLNCIGHHRAFQNYSLEEVNLEWPVKLAQLVADKGNGTKLIHITNLACHQEKARELSKVLSLQYEAECRMKEIYPDTIIIRSAPVYSKRDNFCNLLASPKWKNLAVLGALPLLYDGGVNTVVQPVHLSDLAKAVAIVAREPSCNGQIFEFIGKDRFKLSDMTEFLYSLPPKTECDEPMVCLHNAIGSLDGKNVNILQWPVRMYMEHYFFRRQYRPSLLPRFGDHILKSFSRYTWLSEERYKMLHMSDYLSGGKPGFEQLGFDELTDFEQTIYDLFYSIATSSASFQHYQEQRIPRASSDDIYGEGTTLTKLVQTIQ